MDDPLPGEENADHSTCIFDAPKPVFTAKVVRVDLARTELTKNAANKNVLNIAEIS